MTAAPTRRARLREAMNADIKECACRQLAEGGPPAVTLRGIAREIGVSPAALYGYFDSLEALFTALIVDGYEDLADAVEAAANQPGTPGFRLLESTPRSAAGRSPTPPASGSCTSVPCRATRPQPTARRWRPRCACSSRC